MKNELTEFELYLGKGIERNITLNDHILLVTKFAGIMCDNIGLSDEIKKVIIASALLHDVAKIRNAFQKILKGETLPRIFHHVDGWAVLKKILTNNEENSVILSTVYWHHPKPELYGNKYYLDNCQDILDNLDVEDIELIINYSKALLKYKSIDISFRNDDNDDIDLSEYKIPKFVDDELYSIKLLSRMIVTSADRIASSFEVESKFGEFLSSDEKCKNLLNSIDSNDLWDIKVPSSYDVLRFNNQEKAVDDILSAKTVVFKGTAGYGKTVIGIIASAKQKRKTIWVVPRNIIAYNVYENIVKTLKLLELEHVSVEVYIAGERKSCTHKNISVFDSDIVVTNIDNFLLPTTKNNIAHRLYTLISRLVVFDEFHEFIGGNALFSQFINIMRIRHRYTNSKTILLSATPSVLNKLWDGINDNEKSLIYPNKESHLHAIHSNPYSVEYIEESFSDVLKRIKNDSSKNRVAIFRSLANSQIAYNDTKSDILIHSNYLKNDLNNIKDKIFNFYGNKNRKSDEGEFSVVSAPILEASVDISFLNMYSSTNSPESTLQNIGRCNRWGEFMRANLSLINIKKNKSEDSAKEINYTRELSNLWCNFLKNKLANVSNITLDELYTIYNEYNIKMESIISNYHKTLYNIGTTCLKRMQHPKRNVDELDDDISYYNYGNGNNINQIETFRGIDSGIYYICPIFGRNNEYSKPKKEKYDIYYPETRAQHFHENEINTLKLVKKHMKIITSSKESYYAYSKKFIYGKFTLDDLEAVAINIKTPYIAVDRVYDSEFGYIEGTTIENFSEKSKFKK